MKLKSTFSIDELMNEHLSNDFFIFEFYVLVKRILRYSNLYSLNLLLFYQKNLSTKYVIVIDCLSN